ncbi:MULTISPECIES: hypothetical protein [unclassified Rhizobium]|uniref:hypothetical protein n=1 Tax=unclassified Rhizobium TaxID=2613769 RepID=UPI001FEEBAAD|nr:MULTISPECIES: hypothetical protein [unclassified Rhizobium]
MEKARSLTGTKETAALVREASETLVRVQSGRRLIARGGTMPAGRQRAEQIYRSHPLGFTTADAPQTHEPQDA